MKIISIFFIFIVSCNNNVFLPVKSKVLISQIDSFKIKANYYNPKKHTNNIFIDVQNCNYIKNMTVLYFNMKKPISCDFVKGWFVYNTDTIYVLSNINNEKVESLFNTKLLKNCNFNISEQNKIPNLVSWYTSILYYDGFDFYINKNSVYNNRPVLADLTKLE